MIVNEGSKSVPRELMISYLPVHVAIIMDGNGRWAQARNAPRLAGHRAGVENVRNVIRACVELGIRYLTLYAFSTENWRRPKPEVEGLLSLIDRALERELDQLHENGVQLRHLGSLRRLNPDTRKRVQEAIHLTQDNQRLILNIAFNYGGRAEITHAVRCMIEEGLRPEEVTEDCLSNHLYTAGQPDPDLIIRTGGEMRLSNFLLWQCAYTEFYSTDVFWPDFNAPEFLAALRTFRERNRRYGRLGGA